MSVGANEAKKKLSDLLDMNDPEAVWAEVRTTIALTGDGMDTELVRSAFQDTLDLFQGRFRGYRSCNTEYHDLRHTTDTFLAMTRLIHGAGLNGATFSGRQITIGLTASLLHDAGYIQKADDREGTGAKYTVSHVKRSAEFMGEYCIKRGFTADEIQDGKAMISCTDLGLNFSDISFQSQATELLGKLIASADLLAQMADRTYLEKLLFLFYEFREARIGPYSDERDLLEKTVGFYDFIDSRFETVSESIERFLVSHFDTRWGIPLNLYDEAIERQKIYLKRIVQDAEINPIKKLKRNGIVERVREKYQPENNTSSEH